MLLKKIRLQLECGVLGSWRSSMWSYYACSRQKPVALSGILILVFQQPAKHPFSAFTPLPSAIFACENLFQSLKVQPWVYRWGQGRCRFGLQCGYASPNYK